MINAVYTLNGGVPQTLENPFVLHKGCRTGGDVSDRVTEPVIVTRYFLALGLILPAPCV